MRYWAKSAPRRAEPSRNPYAAGAKRKMSARKRAKRKRAENRPRAEEPSAHEQPSEQTKEQSPEAAEQPLARETAQDEPDGESVGELPCEGAGIIPEESAGEEEERTPDGECGEPLPEREVTDEGEAGLPYGADDDAWEDFVPGGEWSTPSLREVFACEEEGEDAPEPAEDARARKLSFPRSWLPPTTATRRFTTR